MINKYRYLDIILFNIKSPYIIGDLTISEGWNQVIRKDDKYFVKNICENNFYGTFDVSIGHLLLEKLFHNMDD